MIRFTALHADRSGWTHLFEQHRSGLSEPWRAIGQEKGDGNRLLNGWWKAKMVYHPPAKKCADKRVGAQPEAIEWMRTNIARHFADGPASALADVAEQGAPRPGRKKVVLCVHGDRRTFQSCAVMNPGDLTVVAGAGSAGLEGGRAL